MKNTRYSEYLIVCLISILVFIYTLYTTFPYISNALLYVIHVKYLLYLFINMNKYSLLLTSSSLNVFMNTGREVKFRYGLSRVFKIILYTNSYLLLLLFITMITLNRSIVIYITTAVLLLTMNILYTAVIYLVSTFFRNNYLLVATILLVNTTGLLLRNEYLIPILMFPRIDPLPLIITIVVSIKIILFTTMRWSREWVLKP